MFVVLLCEKRRNRLKKNPAPCYILADTTIPPFYKENVSRETYRGSIMPLMEDPGLINVSQSPRVLIPRPPALWLWVYFPDIIEVVLSLGILGRIARQPLGE
jgi:hypothetical protein